MEAGTFLSILAGTIAGGVAVAIAWGPAACCILLLVCAGFGFAASLRVPTAPAGAVPIVANPHAASNAKTRLRMKISFRRQPFVCRFLRCNPNRTRGFPSTHFMGFRRRRSLRLNFAQSKLLAHRPDGPAKYCDN